MSTTVTPRPPLQMARLEEPKTLDDSVRGIDQVVDWAIKAESHIGYFAALYKRITLAIQDAITEGVFDDGDRIGQLGIVFSQRYFKSLNAYFYPDECQGLTLPWEVSFVGDQNHKAIMLQHMMAGLNAHITFDLGLATLAIAGNSLDTLENDFNRVNALLCSQIPGILDVVQQLSPDLRLIRRLIPDEVGLLKRVLTKLRRGAWLFAIYMATHPQNGREKTVNHEAWTAAVGSWYLQPSARWTLFPVLIRVIAKHESRDVAVNIRALEGITNTPEKLNKAYL
ncbi:MAG: DUF5995 family protein [Mycobacterium sp.]|uniref:DUF5995 family protein n=1 Tax=Mycobacterium sp. TaxID=1785 RepID=UPI003F95F841